MIRDPESFLTRDPGWKNLDPQHLKKQYHKIKIMIRFV
jgi:hypothetical protein